MSNTKIAGYLHKYRQKLEIVEQLIRTYNIDPDSEVVSLNLKQELLIIKRTSANLIRDIDKLIDEEKL